MTAREIATYIKHGGVDDATKQQVLAAEGTYQLARIAEALELLASTLANSTRDDVLAIRADIAGEIRVRT